MGLNGAPFSPDFALVKWTDTSTKAISSIKYMGFTTGAKDQSIAFGANCVLLKAEYTNPYVQVSPQQIQALQHQYLEPYQVPDLYQHLPTSLHSLYPKHPPDWVESLHAALSSPSMTRDTSDHFSRPLDD